MQHPIPMPLAAVRQEMSACIKCAACMPVCPTYREARRESMGPRGRLALAVAMLEGGLDPADGVMGPIGSCIDCRACVPACPRHIPLADVFYAAKATLAQARAGGLVATLLRRVSHRVIVGNRFRPLLAPGRLAMAIYHGVADSSPLARLFPFFRAGRKRALPDVVARPLTDRYPEVITVPDPRGRVAFFPGCVINFTGTDIGRATLSALTRLGVEVVLPRDAPCCGIPLLSLGDREGARQVARDVVARYGAIQADWVITACASCGTTLRDTYPQLLKGDAAAQALAARVLDVTEYLTRHTDYAARAGMLTQTITYHDPCHMARGMNVTAEPRRILRDIAGDGFKEMEAPDTCCGFGGLFSALHYDLALEVGARKVERVRQSGARVVATGCPGCQMQMTDTLARGGVPARVLHTVELLDMALDAPPAASVVAGSVSRNVSFWNGRRKGPQKTQQQHD